jgi:hypothetical protein
VTDAIVESPRLERRRALLDNESRRDSRAETISL